MPRSHFETENVQFVQELAEVDGPFESPININFKDLTKLELPSLEWNRSDACPRKMKITNTGHTVIISGKWKCERPYLTGGPLLGKYVFSQIHFHWGSDDRRGSEHLVSGEAFPLEMHVAHFKSDYATQERALREKDGMVVLVYLFKLQEEPNTSLKKILSILPNIKQASCSQALDPRPILSLCNPFTDDYFMYWGSVVTSTCAHILMWLVCREPFGISKEQINEFRKILDSSQQPIFRNNRDTQPLHKRNVFHVNASKNLDHPMLPVKKIFGCFCGKGNEDNQSSKAAKDCSCLVPVKNQEAIEGNYFENKVGSLDFNREGTNPACEKITLPTNIFAYQSLFVQRGAVQSTPLLPKLFENTYLGQLWTNNDPEPAVLEENSKAKMVPRSCCFIPVKEVDEVESPPEKRRAKRKSFNSIKALSYILESLEALKNHTFQKLKEIDSINQEIKGIKLFCEDANDKKWVKRAEKIMSQQKQFTIKTSQSCLSELKKLARECNFDRYFEGKLLSLGDGNKTMWLNNISVTRTLSFSGIYPVEKVVKTSSKPFVVDKALKFSGKAQKLIRSFFEDIQENENLQKSLQKDINLKREKLSYKSQQTDASDSVLSVSDKGFITKKMFNQRNLEDRFFIEVTPNDSEAKTNDRKYKPEEKKLFVSIHNKEDHQKEISDYDLQATETAEKIAISKIQFSPQGIIPLHRVNVAIEFSETSQTTEEPKKKANFNENQKTSSKDLQTSDFASISSVSSNVEEQLKPKSYSNKSPESLAEKSDLMKKDLLDSSETFTSFQNSSLNLSSDSAETQRMIIAKFHKKQSKKNIWKQRQSPITKISSKGLCAGKKKKIRNINVEGYYIKKKNTKSKLKKVQKKKNIMTNESFCDFNSISQNDLRSVKQKCKWKHMTKARFKLKIEKTSDSTTESAIEYSLLNSDSNIIKLKSNKAKESSDNINSSTENGTGRTSCVQKKPEVDDREKRSHSITTKTKNEIASKTVLKNSKKSDKKPEEVQMENCSTIIPICIRPDSGSTKKSAEDISVDPKLNNSAENVEIKKSTNQVPESSIEPIKRELRGFKTKNKSFTSLCSRLKNHSIQMSKRIFIQTNEERRNYGKNIFEFRAKLNNLKAIDAIQTATIKKFGDGISLIPINKFEGTKKQKLEGTDSEDVKLQDFKIGFFTASRQIHQNKSLITAYSQEETNKTSKMIINRCDIEKYHFLDKELQDVKATLKQIDSVVQEKINSNLQTVLKPEPNTNADVKEVEESPTTDNKEIQSSVSYEAVVNAPQSRPHSVESMKKTLKKKHKKRPHCVKRTSRHHIRKNSCVFKKATKVDRKSPNFLNLTTEEQLKVISINVAKYLKQKLNAKKQNIEFKSSKEELEESSGSSKKEMRKEEEKKVEEDAIEEVKILKEKSHEEMSDPETKTQEIEAIESAVKSAPPIEESSEKEETKEKTPEAKSRKGSAKEKHLGSPRPPMNFIKLNKLMAGKYKRINSGSESQSQSQEQVKKIEEPKTITKSKIKNEKMSVTKEPNSSKTSDSQNQRSDDKKKNKKPSKGIPVKTAKSTKKGETEKKNDEEPAGESKALEESDSSLKNLKNVTPPCNLVPTYMVTSYLSTPSLEIMESKHNKMNQYLMSIKNNKLDSYLPEVLYEKKKFYESKMKTTEAIFAQDLENLIKLQMCLNNEMAANIENSMNYIKTLLNQECREEGGTAIVEKNPVTDTLDPYDSSQNGIFLVEMNDLNLIDCSASSSDFGEELERWNSYLDLPNRKSKQKIKEAIDNDSGTPKECGDSKQINPVFVQDLENDDEYSSDSSYNCEISITLNGNTNETDSQIQTVDNYTPDRKSRIFGSESSLSQTTDHLDGDSSSQSVWLKPLRKKKRKENEISMEMKKKLLEILEGEIRREMTLNYATSSQNLSDPFKWDDGNWTTNTSQSTVSSSENTEMIAQISETMRQYLTEYKKKRIVEKDENSEKNQKDDF